MFISSYVHRMERWKEPRDKDKNPLARRRPFPGIL